MPVSSIAVAASTTAEAVGTGVAAGRVARPGGGAVQIGVTDASGRATSLTEGADELQATNTTEATHVSQANANGAWRAGFEMHRRTVVLPIGSIR